MKTRLKAKNLLTTGHVSLCTTCKHLDRIRAVQIIGTFACFKTQKNPNRTVLKCKEYEEGPKYG